MLYFILLGFLFIMISMNTVRVLARHLAYREAVLLQHQMLELLNKKGRYLDEN